VQNLALQVAQIDLVVIDDHQSSNSGGGEVERSGGAKATRTDEQNRAIKEPLLGFGTKAGQREMAGIAKLLIRR